MITKTKETIGPEIASVYLEKNSPDNRPINKGHLRKMVRDLVAGRLKSEKVKEPVQFNVQGFLCNGQHRMMATIQSGTVNEWDVEYNVPVEDYEYMDQGLPRTLANNFKLAGASDAQATQKFVALYAKLRTDEDTSNKFNYSLTNTEGVELWRRLGKSEIDKYLTLGRIVRDQTLNTLQVGAVLKMIYDSIDFDRSEIFWDCYINNGNFEGGIKDPVAQVIKYMQKEYIDRSIHTGRHGTVFSDNERVGLIHMSWEHFLKEDRFGAQKAKSLFSDSVQRNHSITRLKEYVRENTHLFEKF